MLLWLNRKPNNYADYFLASNLAAAPAASEYFQVLENHLDSHKTEQKHNSSFK